MTDRTAPIRLSRCRMLRLARPVDRLQLLPLCAIPAGTRDIRKSGV